MKQSSPFCVVLITIAISAFLIAGTAREARAAHVIVKNMTSLYTSYLGIDLVGAAKRVLIGAGYPVKETMEVSAFRFESFIHYNPIDRADAERIRSLIGVGALAEDRTLDPGLIKVMLGTDAIGVFFAGKPYAPGVIILDATGRGGNGQSVRKSIEAAVPVLSVLPVNKGMTEKTIIFYPKGMEKTAETIRLLLGRGIKKEVSSPHLFVVIAPDYIGETFRKIPDFTPTPGETYSIVIHKTMGIMDLVDSAGSTAVRYPISIGANPDLADKKAAGDRRTPEGDYVISGISESSGWKYEGELAYGPWFFALSTPPWTGYAIHGTNEPYLIGAPASHGCIRLNVENLLVLKKAVGAGTKVKIVH
ncbi:MAG: L,D-transpeptidase family protein [Deltaproteobacteria bacterium]|nr:L,D-transpeptidase family protein [Candidatus Zymogenaceae bacterium]